MGQGGIEKKEATGVKMCLACNTEFRGVMTTCPKDGTALIALKNEDDFIGQTLADRYYITEIIGKGGMGVVYLARHQMMDRLVAIKMLQAELCQDDVSVKRFQQEAQAASCLNHPHIITLHDYGIMPTGQPFLVMEYLEGVPLIDIIKRRGPLDPQRAIRMFADVADGLHHAHNQGIVHRDLKPSNIILINHEGDSDFVKIVDFGLAKLMPWSGKESQHLTKTGEVFGSPIYMSPEQCMGKPLGRTSDIYSLGITLFEAVTGKPPFRGSNSIQTASQHMSNPPPRFAEVRPDLALPEGLERVVLKSLAKEPNERFQDMAEFKDALQSALGNDSKIEIPASLMVSRAHPIASQTVSMSRIPSLDKSNISQLRAKESAPPRVNPVLLGGIAALLIAIAGGGWFAYSSMSAPVESKGVTTYFDKQNAELHLYDREHQILHKLNTSEMPSSSLIGHFGDTTSSLVLGQMLSVSYSPGSMSNKLDGKMLKAFEAGDDKSVESAGATVSSFLTEMSDENFEHASTYLNNARPEELKDRFKGKMLHAGTSLLNDHPELTQGVRPGHSLKIGKIEGTELVVYADKSMYLKDMKDVKQGYWQFDVSTDGTKIEKMSEASAEDWNKY